MQPFYNKLGRDIYNYLIQNLLVDNHLCFLSIVL